MHIRTSGVPKDLRKITRDGVKFYCETFLHPRTFSRIELVKVLFTECDDKEDLAFCEPVFTDTVRPVRFNIGYNEKIMDMRTRPYMISLFHELTHMRQYATGELKYLRNGCKWQGKFYPDDTFYWLQPWELDAQGMEKTAYTMFSLKHPQYKLNRYKPKYRGRKSSGWEG